MPRFCQSYECEGCPDFVNLLRVRDAQIFANSLNVGVAHIFLIL